MVFVAIVILVDCYTNNTYRPISSLICAITNCTVYIRKKFHNSKCHAHWTARWSSLVVHLDVKIARESLILSFLGFQATQSKG